VAAEPPSARKSGEVTVIAPEGKDLIDHGAGVIATRVFFLNAAFTA